MRAFEFTTIGLPEGQKREWFHGFISGQYGISFSDLPNEEFLARERGWVFNDQIFYLTDQSPFAQWRKRPSPDAVLDRINLVCVEKGSGQVVVGDTSRPFQTGDVIVSNHISSAHMRRLSRLAHLRREGWACNFERSHRPI